MKSKKVDCFFCEYFEPPVFDESLDNSFISKIVKPAKCKLGKRVMFRTNGHPDLANYNVGYFRYCSQFFYKTK